MRPLQVCNLSSVVCRPGDQAVDLAEKVRLATMLGTIQSMAEHFPGFRAGWVRNQQEERLLGVDLNGQMDCPKVQEAWVLSLLKAEAYDTNEQYARKLGINQSAAIQTTKPSGNSSQMLNASSGLHARWSPYYIRNVRFNTKSPVRRLLADQGVPMVPEVGQTAETANTWVVPFPVKSPDGAICRKDRTAWEQLEYVARVRKYYTEHQPSVTITYRPEELETITEWVVENRNIVAGLSFLPADDHVYQLAPYVEVSAEEYARVLATFPATVDMSQIEAYEAVDMSTASQDLACVAGVCETP